MYVLNASFSQSPDTVAPHVPAHGQWVKKYLDQGVFLFAAARKSGLGGVVLARSIPKAELLAILAEDSYVQADVAEYQIIDVDVKAVGAGLDALKVA
jgi:uncharacterized protein YciI